MKRLSEKEKRAILADYADGMKLKDIAKKHCVGMTYASNLASRCGIEMRWSIEHKCAHKLIAF